MSKGGQGQAFGKGGVSAQASSSAHKGGNKGGGKGKKRQAEAATAEVAAQLKKPKMPKTCFKNSTSRRE